MEEEGRDLLRASGVSDEDVRVRRLCEMRYEGQGHEVTVGLPDGPLGPEDADQITTRYRKAYLRLYSREGPDVPLEAITWRLEVSAPLPEILLDGRESTVEAPGGARKGERVIYLPEEEGFLAVPVYDRYRLPPGATFEGPAVVEERESTVVLGPESSARIDEARNLVVRWSG